MKKIIFFIMLSAVAVVVSGCGAHRSANLEATKSGISHTNNSFGFFPNSIGPEEMANAKLTLALAEQIKNESATRQVTGEGKYTGVIINNDPNRTTYVMHPEMSVKLKITSGSFAFISTNKIPEKFIVYNAEGNPKEYKAYKKNGTFNGVAYDYGIRILQN